jgi:hypothetical protein
MGWTAMGKDGMCRDIGIGGYIPSSRFSGGGDSPLQGDYGRIAIAVVTPDVFGIRGRMVTWFGLHLHPASTSIKHPATN